jgi:hypothetical protein
VVPAESTTTALASPAAAKASASISSAIGDRQIFPVQTAMIRYGLDIEDMEQAWGILPPLG